MASGRLIYTGQVVVDISIAVDHMPPVGGDIFGTHEGFHVGGGFNTMYAATRMGAEVVYAGSMGVGPLADMASDMLAQHHIVHIGPIVPIDQGYSVALIDRHAERTFISTRGAETQDPADTFTSLDMNAHDIVIISGYSLVHQANTRAITQLLQQYQGMQSNSRPRIIVDTTPVIADIAEETLALLCEVQPIWSANKREAQILYTRIADMQQSVADTQLLDSDRQLPDTHTQLPVGDMQSAADTPSALHCAQLASHLAHTLGTVIVRAGEQGAWIAQRSIRGMENAIHIPTIPVHPVDTNGAGDCHTGTLAALLLEDMDLHEALHRANIAAALATEHKGPATCPAREEVEHYYFEGK